MRENKELRLLDLEAVAGGSSSKKIKTVDSRYGGCVPVYSAPSMRNSCQVGIIYPGDKVEVLSDKKIGEYNDFLGDTIYFISIRVISNNVVGYVNADFIV